MKKLLCALLLLTAVLLMTFPALAEGAQEEWNARCNWAIDHDTPLYSAALKADVSNATDLYEFTAAGMLPADTPVRIRSTSGAMREILYWDGGECTGWVESSAVRWIAGNPSAAESASIPDMDFTDAWKALPVTLNLGEGNSEPVTLQQLGAARSIVHNGAEFKAVPTEDLYWESEADAEHRLAIIHAPKTGKATLRASASSKAKSLGQCEAGRVVIVLKVGSTFSRVLYDGQEGCVLTDALLFTASVPEKEHATATLCYNGRTDTAATISVYADQSTQRKIGQWRVGNEVVVVSESGDWREVEIDGWHGWVKADFLK